MASKPKFRGSTCKQTCGGHRAGYAYARGGGKKYSASSSFNKGMMIFLGLLPRRRRK